MPNFVVFSILVFILTQFLSSTFFILAHFLHDFDECACLSLLPRFVSLIQEYQAGKKPKLQRVKQKTLPKLFLRQEEKKIIW